VRRRFEDVLAKKKGNGTPDDRWLLCYNPARWAGLSVIAHVIKNSSQLLVPRSLAAQDIFEAMASATHLSLTPSMFRKILLHGGGAVSAIPIRQITFGGENATQKALDDAKAIWPEARITHVYASTERGDICSVSDAREGIPRDKLRNCELAQDGELILDGQATGDLWQCHGDRLLFAGRVQEMINVGGAKVAPSLVENACMGNPRVLECRAYSVRNALLGEVVGLDYVGSIEPRELRTFLLSAVPKFAVPARIARVDAIPVTSAGKISRRP
jgi:acyl-CoA synthetase (AMP-forming)/AMP-acid ligase II